jgi:hypothetical protein
MSASDLGVLSSQLSISSLYLVRTEMHERGERKGEKGKPGELVSGDTLHAAKRFDKTLKVW